MSLTTRHESFASTYGAIMCWNEASNLQTWGKCKPESTPISFSIFLLWLWACWMVTSQNMAASHGNACPSVSFPLVGVTTWKLEIRLQVRKLLKSEGRRESRDRLERQNHRKRGGDGGRRGKKGTQRRGTSWEKKIWRKEEEPRFWNVHSVFLNFNLNRRKSVFSFLGYVLLENSCRRSLFRTRCSGNSHKDSSCRGKGWSTSGSGP